MKNTLIIHIGYGKTGTSAIQSFLTQNRRTLSKYNVYYPDLGRDRTHAHHEFATAARPIKDTGYDSGLTSFEFIRKLALELENRAEEIIVLSSEIFSGEIVFSNLQPLKKLFHHIKIVAYVRRQDQLIMSSYQQWVKDGTYHIDFSDVPYLPYFFSTGLLNWSRFIKNIGIVLVRPYERVQLFKGDVISDFLYHVLGLDPTDTAFHWPKKDVNARLGRTCFLFKNIANQMLDAEKAHVLLQCLTHSCEHIDQADTWDGSIASPVKRLEWMARFKNGNIWIAQNLMGRENGILFMNDTIEANPDWALPILSEEEAAKISNALLKEKAIKFDPPIKAEQIVRDTIRELFWEH